MKIFITGGKGSLGQKLIKHLSDNHIVYAPDKEACDILDLNKIKDHINMFSPEIVIHLAAFVDTFGCEKNIEKALNINVIGTLNVVKACLNIDCKFIYVSSEYVFGGNKGNYDIKDKLDPINIYGKTKAASEYIISVLPNYQIIRVPFIKKIYPKVFVNQYCSRYFLDDIIDKIIYNIINNDNTLIHISSERASLYEIYTKKGINVEPVKIPDEYSKIIPKDTSLINNSI